jgi:N-acetylmuramoyl-L-alanine amidase
VLALALKTGGYIEKYLPDVHVIYTRTTDVLIPLDERANIANRNNADLFISIHANSNTSSRPFGTESFVMGLHKTAGNLEVAKKENSVITYEENYKTKYEGFDPNDVESYIMISLVQDTYLEYSLEAASLVQQQFRDRTMRKDRGVSQAGFLVLWKTSTPSILIETGFISNPKEEEYLMSEQGQDYLSSAIFRAFRNYKASIEGTSTIVKDARPADTVINAPAINEDKNPAITNKAELSVHANDTGSKALPDSNISPHKAIEPSKNTRHPATGTLFKVQILYSENKVDLKSELFKDFNDVEEIESSGNFKYVVGSASTYPEAVEYSKWVKSRYPDAFIVAVSKGKIVPLTQALNDLNN